MTEPGAATASGRPRRGVYLHAGHVHASAEPCAITTVLGSCVSVCLYDRAAGVGGMNHFLLPLATDREASPRFGPHAMQHLVRAVLAAGGRRDALEAKVFGGAAIIAASRSVGAENVQVALQFLRAAGIPTREGDHGGAQGRKVIFHTDEGVAWVRLL